MVRQATARRKGTTGQSPKTTPPEPAVEEPQTQVVEQAPDFVIPGPLAQAILNYLASKPFAEVYQMVTALQNLQVIVPVEGEQVGPKAA